MRTLRTWWPELLLMFSIFGIVLVFLRGVR